MSTRTLTRAAMPRPSTVNDAARTVELVIATATDPGDGVILSLGRMPDHGPAPVPVLLGHVNSPHEQAGRIRDLRIERGQLIGLAEFIDAPAAEAGWQLARSGSAVSVGASYSPDAIQPQPDGVLLVNRWRLREASLVPVGADPLALTRSLDSLPSMTDANVTITTADTTEALDRSAADTKEERAFRKLETTVLRAAVHTEVPAPVIEEIIRTHRGRPEVEAMTALIREHRLSVERRAPVHAGHPARIEPPAAPELETAITRAMSGQALDRPIVEVLRSAGYTGRNGADVVRQAFSGQRPESWLSRGFLSTSDAKDLLLSTGDRRLQEQFQEPARGIRELARMRELQDFRSVSVLDVGLVGAAEKILEGGEIKYKSLADSAGSYKASRYGMGFAVSYEAMANDDLGGLDQVLMEMSATMIEAESNALAALLTEGSTGAKAPDGKAVFHADHANTITDALGISGLTNAVKKLRGAVSVGGRKLWLEPGFILVGPELEATAAALLSDLWQATTATDANPWRLQMVVEPSIADTKWYLVAAGPRKPFELGRIAGLPRMLQEEHFDTSSMRFKVEHGFGCAVADHRVIVRSTPGA